jgi:hypothetical protein
MSARDPGAAVCESIAAYLETALAGVVGIAVIRGWPETDTDVDLATGPSVSITQIGNPTEETSAPVPTGEVGDLDDDTILMRLGLLTIPLQLDGWAGSREALDALCTAVDDALQNDLPYRPHLYLDADDYYGRSFLVTRQPDAPDYDGDSADTGEWRHTWTLEAKIERVQSIAGVALETVTVPVTITT